MGLASFGSSYAGVSIQAEAVFSDPNDACSAVSNAGELQGKIALVLRGTCWFDEKAARIQEAGALACVVVNTIGVGAFGMKASDSGVAEAINIPVGM